MKRNPLSSDQQQRRRITALGAFALLGLLRSRAASAASTDESNCLQAELAAQPGFSGVVLFRQRGQLFSAVQGTDDGKAFDLRSRFNLGSASKMFTAVAVGQLHEAGKLELDGPIGRWVDGLTAPVAAVTVRDLLSHSAGLGNFFKPAALPALQAARSVSDLLPLLDDKTPRFTPGSRFEYSNSGFLLLGRAIEQAAGISYADYLRQHVFMPAGMLDSSLSPQLPKPAVQGMTRRVDGQSPGAAPSEALRPAAEATLPANPAGGAYASAIDMQLFFDALQAGQLLHAETLKIFTEGRFEISPPGAPLRVHYGLGFGLLSQGEHRGFGHNGGTPGVFVDAMHFPADDWLLVLLSNGDPPLSAPLLTRLRRLALQGALCPRG